MCSLKLLFVVCFSSVGFMCWWVMLLKIWWFLFLGIGMVLISLLLMFSVKLVMFWFLVSGNFSVVFSM